MKNNRLNKAIVFIIAMCATVTIQSCQEESFGVPVEQVAINRVELMPNVPQP